jgi:superfamily II DNA or RNA helicase
MSKFYAAKLNEVYLQVDADELHMLKELVDYFTFKVPGAEFMPAYKNKYWDGKIRLFNPTNCKLYVGLLNQLKFFCDKNGYELSFEDDLTDTNFTDNNLQELCKYIDPYSQGKKIEYRDYQLDAIKHAINYNRALLLSPTASGKSLIIYTLVRFYNMHPNVKGKKILIIVPTTSLVSQMYSDFADYGWDVEKYCHKIFQGQSKETNKKVVISTWQSIYKMPRDYWDQFNVVVGDECHLFKANSLNKIMDRLTGCKYRFGTTGTLDGSKTHKLVLTGLFGDVKQVTTTRKLIDSKTLADFSIKCIVLKYPEKICKEMKGTKYAEEVEWIVTNNRRNEFIKNLVLDLKGNTLVLFNFVEKHGIPLHNLLKDGADENRRVFFVHGGVDAEVREEIRRITEKEKNAIIVASYGTFSTGVNIRNLHNVIFTSPSKSRVRNLQSIGRGLRKGNNKESAVLYDIADDMKYKSHMNFALRHFYERLNIYNEEKFDFKIHEVKISE